ncbi:MAG: Gfo/Idh/MocA family oxidoreductase [Bacteroidetes bacterium]|nr:Gfo/Idh/MocA family oxidoreductase [Bacteroidota bacterium]
MKKLTRRNFIGTATAGVAGTILVPTILPSCATGNSVSDRITIAHIGVGSQGQGELKNYFVELETSYQVATCDPFQQRRNASAHYINEAYKERGLNAPKCKSYRHFDEILERDDIDAVHITTPDHWHVPLAIQAARAGKHIMLAKPLGLSYPNFKILEQELKANDVRFHYGTQQRASRHMQLGIEMIKDGTIGEIEKVEVWAPGFNAVESPVCNEVPVPTDFDFDLWTGPAPLNSYCPDRVTNNSSWFQYDYSIGFLGGWGAHPLDVMIWGLKDKMNGKYTCEGVGEFWKPGGMYNNIRGWDLNCEYDSGIKLHFYSTDVAEKKDLLHYRNVKEGNGTTFYGTKGWISLSRSSVQSNIPEIDKKLNDFLRKDENFGQMFVDVIRGNIAETNPLDEAILSDCVSHMGDIAIRTGRKITWDPIIGEVVGDAEANKWFVREMREPYKI